MKLTFHGGAGTVTGANYLLESDGVKILVDCGLQQGSHFAEHQNFEPFAYQPSEIKAVFVTHAHIDHIGRLPKLIKEGFKGVIYSTHPTKAFAELMLLDSMQILAKESERENRPPLYEEQDIERLMQIWRGLEYHEPVNVGPYAVTLFDAGHILGSAIVHVGVEGKTVVFSGDLGNSPAPVIRPTEKIPSADYCLIESTYGDRLHEDLPQREELLEDAIEDSVKAGGVLMIPAFAMERTQDLLFHLHQLFERGRIPKVPVFIDSPLAIQLTAIYKKFERYFNEAVQHMAKRGDDILNFPGLRLTLTTEQSKEINEVPSPKIIIAGSGMSNGGRILHHERRYLSDPKSTILFVGYQAEGTLGRKIIDGAQSVRMFDEDVSVRCKIRSISGYSAHADQAQLLAWVKPMRMSLKKIFVIQGEPTASEVFARKIRDEFAIEAEVPKAGETVTL